MIDTHIIRRFDQVYSEFLKSQQYIGSGFRELDRAIEGFKKGNIYIIGDDPAQEKQIWDYRFAAVF